MSTASPSTREAARREPAPSSAAPPRAVPVATPPSVDPMLPRPYRVRDVARETADTVSLTLEAADDRTTRTFRPGQFNMLYVFGVGEVPISVSGDPTRNDRLVHTVRRVGAVSRALAALGDGDPLGERGPYGSAWPVDGAVGRDVVFVAGGIGLAPLRPAVYQVLARRRDYGRVVLLYGARRPEDLLFRGELEQWRGRFDLEVRVTVDNADQDAWFGEVGVVTRLLHRAPFEPGHTTAFVCGPEVMMRFTVRELVERGVAPADAHLSLERNMRCGVGLCGHCQLGPDFVCTDGPVFLLPRVERLLPTREL